MAKQVIDIDTPDSRQGTTVRDSFNICNDNFTELYNGAANGSLVTDASAWRTALELGSAAQDDTGDFATAAQGATADSAVQPDERYVADYTPVYDLASSVLASTIYHDLGTVTVASGKKWYVNNVTATNDSTGDGQIAAYYWNLTAGDDSTVDSVRGAFGQVAASGASLAKSVHVSAVGLTGHTGVLVGVAAIAEPVATTSESYAFQATLGDDSTAAMVINPQVSGDAMDYGIYFRAADSSLPAEINIAGMQMDAVGAGDFLKLRDATATNTLFNVSPAGNVGVNRASTDAKVSIAGLGGGAGASEVVRFNRTDDGNRYNSIFSTSNTGTNSAVSIRVHDGVTATSQAQVITATGAGRVGINTSAPDQALDVVGTIQASNLLGGAVNITTDASGNIIRDPSDERLKQNIQPISGALETLLGLRGVTFEWKDAERFGSQTETGFIAQEVAKVLPGAVSTDGEYWSMSDRGIVAVLVEAVKALESRIQELESRT